jgi:hypothetical protein
MRGVRQENILASYFLVDVKRDDTLTSEREGREREDTAAAAEIGDRASRYVVKRLLNHVKELAKRVNVKQKESVSDCLVVRVYVRKERERERERETDAAMAGEVEYCSRRG